MSRTSQLSLPVLLTSSPPSSSQLSPVSSFSRFVVIPRCYRHLLRPLAKMFTTQALLTLAAAGLSSAHFTLKYPEWRGNTFDDTLNYTQWSWPCGGPAYGSGNRTDWPLSGGSLGVTLGHAYNFLYINLGIEENGTVASFPTSLTPNPLNTTGSGTLCLSDLLVPSDLNITAGTNASLQVIKVGRSGQAQYNCADIRFVEDAPEPTEEQCATDDGAYFAIEPQSHEEANATDGEDGDDAASGDEDRPLNDEGFF
ncbi:hypothetical protein SODALDRAFT_133882 [Sodiomyces alkalinus F11]|uniref:Copper acquisition factor BIM1-like domain-containing protein n=1 Tax=Sodiomyces alkalinus (strain CBS 110278 / VKM F-3762 / F11) TaxID=1314773 RepID=A0A3N2PYI0_SODAK|nr:hypothetical protein SODALDRAFT_133882 [Sodiomyces alkalinus F11]ROT39591.1 hypothetical protein SODALDRAFT_133882 [Sodiomyces alkalinus F11]